MFEWENNIPFRIYYKYSVSSIYKEQIPWISSTKTIIDAVSLI